VRPGLPLGEGAEPFEATELQLSPGDVLSFYTGALARDPFHTRGLTVVREGTAGGAEGGRPVTELGGRILEKLLQEPWDDDLALLVTQVRRLPEDATAAWELAADPSIVAGIRRRVEPLRDRWRLYALTPAAGWGWC
jgi:sodium/proline symporter